MCLTLDFTFLMTFLRQIFLLCTMLNQTLAFFLIGWVTNGPSHDGFQDEHYPKVSTVSKAFLRGSSVLTTTVHIRSHTSNSALEQHNDEQWLTDSFQDNKQLKNGLNSFWRTTFFFRTTKEEEKWLS